MMITTKQSLKCFPWILVTDTNYSVNRFSPMIRLLVVAITLVIAGSGCSGGNASRAVTAPLMVGQQDRAPQDHGTLSRAHSVVINVPETDLEMRFRRVVDRCAVDSAHHCTILQSDLTTGQFPSGLIKLRLDPGAVEDLVSFAASLGKLEHRSTKVEDLADAIQDTQSRIEMLTNYRKQLLQLQAKAATNVEAAIKIASELSTVQGDLERATGEAAYQTKRVSTDIVTIKFAVAEQRAFWR